MAKSEDLRLNVKVKGADDVEDLVDTLDDVAAAAKKPVEVEVEGAAAERTLEDLLRDVEKLVRWRTRLSRSRSRAPKFKAR